MARFALLLLLPFFTLTACASKATPPAQLLESEDRPRPSEQNDLADFEAEFSNEPLIADPLAPINRATTSLNALLYEYALAPLLRVYAFIVPEFARLGMRNFFDNLHFPLRFTSNFLQGKFHAAGIETKRFIANTLLGWGGLVDVSSHLGLAKQEGDLGTLLAHWGVGGGFHIVWPILGPSNLRDSLAGLGNGFFNPIRPTSYISQPYLSLALRLARRANGLSFHIDESLNIIENTPNLYPFLRDAYELRRQKLAQ